MTEECFSQNCKVEIRRRTFWRWFNLNRIVVDLCSVLFHMASEQTGLHPRLSSQIQEKFLALQQTQKIYDQKDSWRVEMELIIQELYPTCRLVLCGSSANGFGSIDSDIDMDLVLGTENRFVRTGDMLRRIESLFTRKPRRFKTEVF